MMKMMKMMKTTPLFNKPRKSIDSFIRRRKEEEEEEEEEEENGDSKNG